MSIRSYQPDNGITISDLPLIFGNRVFYVVQALHGILPTRVIRLRRNLNLLGRACVFFLQGSQSTEKLLGGNCGTFVASFQPLFGLLV